MIQAAMKIAMQKAKDQKEKQRLAQIRAANRQEAMKKTGNFLVDVLEFTVKAALVVGAVALAGDALEDSSPGNPCDDRRDQMFPEDEEWKSPPRADYYNEFHEGKGLFFVLHRQELFLNTCITSVSRRTHRRLLQYITISYDNIDKVEIIKSKKCLLLDYEPLLLQRFLPAMMMMMI